MLPTTRIYLHGYRWMETDIHQQDMVNMWMNVVAWTRLSEDPHAGGIKGGEGLMGGGGGAQYIHSGLVVKHRCLQEFQYTVG